jgi:hypothetical protein
MIDLFFILGLLALTFSGTSLQRIQEGQGARAGNFFFLVPCHLLFPLIPSHRKETARHASTRQRKTSA